MLAIAASCNNRTESNDNKNAARNTEENVEENSGENISPQLVDSTDRFKVDSISSADEANEQKENDLDGSDANQ